jgi:uncharacterized phiE125 gp8 family phage protein
MHPFRTRLLERVVAPATEPVSLADAKQYLRIEHTADDTLISQLIVTARQSAERYLRQSLITQSWKIAYDDFLEAKTILSFGPVQSVTSVTTYDITNQPIVIPNTFYRMDAARRVLLCQSSIVAVRVEIIYQAGYGAAADVPSPIKQGILLHVAKLYDTRDLSAHMPDEVESLYRVFQDKAI